MADTSTPEDTVAEADGITEEQYQLALDAGSELFRVNSALKGLEAAHRIGYHDMSLAPERNLYKSPLYAKLTLRRSELYSMLLDIG